MGWIRTRDELPPEGKYVLARHSRGTWVDKGDQANVNCVVVKLVRGISKDERERMKAGELPDPNDRGSLRSNVFYSEDQWCNNRVPYAFEAFGPDTFFGQDIVAWMPIERYVESESGEEGVGDADTAPVSEERQPDDPEHLREIIEELRVQNRGLQHSVFTLNTMLIKANENVRKHHLALAGVRIDLADMKGAL